MFEQVPDYPTAIASYDPGGVNAAIGWCRYHLEDGDDFTVWTPLKSNLSNCTELEQLVVRHRNVHHTTGRGGSHISGTGPVLMAWPDMNDIGELTRFASDRIRALCVINWNDRQLRPWVSAVQPELLGDTTPWEQRTPPLDPIVELAMESVTRSINHSNTISAGYEKDDVVSTLLALHDAGLRLDPDALQGWALAHGWTGDNPKRLAAYATDINNGKRPRTHRRIRSDYVESLRQRIATESEDDQ